MRERTPPNSATAPPDPPPLGSRGNGRSLRLARAQPVTGAQRARHTHQVRLCRRTVAKPSDADPGGARTTSGAMLPRRHRRRYCRNGPPRHRHQGPREDPLRISALLREVVAVHRQPAQGEGCAVPHGPWTPTRASHLGMRGRRPGGEAACADPEAEAVEVTFGGGEDVPAGGRPRPTQTIWRRAARRVMKLRGLSLSPLLEAELAKTAAALPTRTLVRYRPLASSAKAT